MLQGGKLKTAGRIASLALLLMTMMGPWFIDSHPSAEEACSPPLVWLGGGSCACLVSYLAAISLAVIPGHSGLWLLTLPPALPFLSTLLLFLNGERRWLWVCHLAAWGLAAVYSLFLFAGLWYSHPVLRLWGAGLCGVVAAAALAGEILAGRSPTLNTPPGIN